MAGNVGSVAVRAGFDGSDLSRGLRRSRGELEEFAKNAKRAFQFGVGEAGVNILRTGVNVATAALRASRGDFEAVYEVLDRLPFGLGALIRGMRELRKELPFNYAAAQIKEAATALRDFQAVVNDMDVTRGVARGGAATQRRWGSIQQVTRAYLNALSGMPSNQDMQRMLDQHTQAGLDQWKRAANQRADVHRAYYAELREIDRQYIEDRRRELTQAIGEDRAIYLRNLESFLRAGAAEKKMLRDNAIRQDELAGGRRAWARRFGEPDDIEAGERAGREAVEEIRQQREEERRANQERFEEAAAAGMRGQRVLDDINRENRIMRVRAKRGELAADLQAIHEEYEAKRQALRDENAELNADAIKALQQGERMALAERRKQAASMRHSLVDISGQALMLGAPNPADSSRFLRPMLGVLSRMNRREGRKDFAVRQWGPAFGGG